MDYLATFHTNFGAQCFHQYIAKLGQSKMRPVPRELSSSCGTCVAFTTSSPIDDFDESQYQLEMLYEVKDGSYILIKEYD